MNIEMNKKLRANDRVQVIDSGLNPLTNFYVAEELPDGYRCRFDYKVLSGYQDFPKYKVSRHPIQECQFKLEIHIRGGQCPDTNDFTKYFEKFGDRLLLFRMSIFCFDEILNNINDPRHREIALGILDGCLKEENPVQELDEFITGSVNNFPMDFDSTAVIEYTGKDQVIVVYNSENIQNNNTTVIFLLCFTAIVMQLNLVSRDTLLKRIEQLK